MPSLPRVVCLGEMLWDYIADQIADSPDQVSSWTAYPGGAPANVACALTKLGTPAGLIGCIGMDKAGNELVTLLDRLTVNTQGIQRHPIAPTRQIEVLRSSIGDRQFYNFRGGTTETFADTYLQAALLPPILFETADFLVLGTLGLASPSTRTAIATALQLAQQYQLKVLIDINWRSMFWSHEIEAKALILQTIEQADFLKLAEEEADWLFGSANPTVIHDDIQTRMHRSIDILITAGAKGCTYWLQGNRGKLPAFPVNIQDTTGAGDSFVAGFLHQLVQRGIDCLADGNQAQAIVRYANAVAALTTQQLGAIETEPSSPALIAATIQSLLDRFSTATHSHP